MVVCISMYATVEKKKEPQRMRTWELSIKEFCTQINIWLTRCHTQSMNEAWRVITNIGNGRKKNEYFDFHVQ